MFFANCCPTAEHGAWHWWHGPTHPSYYLLEPNTEVLQQMCQCPLCGMALSVLLYFWLPTGTKDRKLVNVIDWKPSKLFHFCILICNLDFGEILPVKKRLPRKFCLYCMELTSHIG
jgi:hypothetical protein